MVYYTLGGSCQALRARCGGYLHGGFDPGRTKVEIDCVDDEGSLIGVHLRWLGTSDIEPRTTKRSAGYKPSEEL
jgi:hypothetical protein